MSYTKRNLREIEDSAVKYGFSEHQEARFPRSELGAATTGLAHLKLKPGKREPFAHRHREAEEIVLVLSGSGRIKLDDDVIELAPLDAVRVSPGVTRALEADDDGLEVVVFGAHVEGDVEMVQDFWADHQP
jgi:quercetin dioxygenase-like cupin family protein